MPEKNIIVLVLIVVPLLLLAALFFKGDGYFIPLPESTTLPILKINDVAIRVEIADTPEARTRGLSGRTSLPENQGMLFVFSTDAPYGIWMKDMHFAIDIVWLSAEGRIVDIKANVVPETYPEVFYPRADARYVLELPARLTELRSVSLGDLVELPESLKE